MSINTKKYIETHLKIKDKNAKLIEFEINKPQQKLYDALAEQHAKGLPMRAIILKARQMGFSTLTEGIIFKLTATEHNVNSGIVAHEIQATNNLFNMSKRYYDNLPDMLKPSLRASNAKELVFNNSDGSGLGSSIKCMTAGNNSIGRSDTFQNLHISEYAFWQGNKQETLTGLMQSVPNKPSTMVIIESTANGYDDFKDMWDKSVNGENDFVPVFCAWWELEEYKMPYYGYELTQAEKELMADYNLNKDQITWRRWCIKNNCMGDVEKFKQEYPSNPFEAFLMSGSTVFDAEELVKRRALVQKVLPCHIEEIKGSMVLQEANDGYWYIYKQPVKGKSYCMGVDVAEGLENGDYSTVKIMDSVTLEDMATLQAHIDPDKLAEEVYKMGTYYGNALISVEVNMEGGVVRNLERMRYSNLYVREVQDDITHKLVKKFGWRTTETSRRLLVSNLIEYVRDHSHLINCPLTIDEMLTFIRNKNGRPEGQEGKHDDLVMATGICLEACLSGQQSSGSFERQYNYEKINKMEKDIQDDFARADKLLKDEMANRMELWK